MKDQGIERLALGGSRNLAIHHKMREKTLHVPGPKFAWMRPAAVELDIAQNPRVHYAFGEKP